MKHSLLTIIAIFTVCLGAQGSTVRGFFNWSDPGSLSPAFPAPNADNRYGEYISNVTFSDNGVTVMVNEDDVKEKSQCARFLYGYLTQAVEMRAYHNSDIIITAPEGMVVKRVQFTGAKADANYLTPYDENSAFNGQEWSTEQPGREVKFYVEATINCNSITVICTEAAGVEDIVADADAEAATVWYTLSGIAMNEKPSTPGVYVRRQGAKVSKVVIKD